MTHDDDRYQEGVLVLPRLRVQNANAISSSMTWGFPSITAFIGLMHALARRLPALSGLEFRGVGVICHEYEAQVTEGGYTRAFRLTRNPVGKDGKTLGIVEEARIHLDITLVFLVNVAESRTTESERQQLATEVNETVAMMRIAGGSVLPRIATRRNSERRMVIPQLRLLPDDPDDRRKEFRRMSRRWLPGFALVSRDDLLVSHLLHLQKAHVTANTLDAWLDLSRLNHRAERTMRMDDKTRSTSETIEWLTERRKGWTVPMPVGYAALSDVHPPGTVANARDSTTPFRFVESVYSIGEWISPHRLSDVNDLLWYGQYDDDVGLYRCKNDFIVAPPFSASSTQPDQHQGD